MRELGWSPTTPKAWPPSWKSAHRSSPAINVMSTALSTQTVVAVVGTGAMGAGIAQVAAAAGHTVKLLDNRPVPQPSHRRHSCPVRQDGRQRQDEPPTAAQAAGARLQPVEQLADLADAALVVEAIVESLEAKQKLYRDLEAIVGGDCIFGTNTSSISVTAIGARSSTPSAWPACTSSTRHR
jgi:3-hydroxybutyryl-CoA dehydrogenase